MEDDDLVIEEPASYREIASDWSEWWSEYCQTPYPWMAYGAFATVGFAASIVQPSFGLDPLAFAIMVGLSALYIVRNWGETHE